MNFKRIISSGLSLVLLCLSTISSYASSPPWTFTPLTPTAKTVTVSQNADIRYLVTNQSNKVHTLAINPMVGVSQKVMAFGDCTNPFTLSYGSSCILNLAIDGSLLQGSFVGGPVACEQGGGSLQCYQPGQEDILNITLGQQSTVTLNSITVSPSVVTISPPTPQQFTATGNYSDGSVQDLTQLVNWTSLNPTLVIIFNTPGNRGLAFRFVPGTTQIIASLGGIISAPSTVN